MSLPISGRRPPVCTLPLLAACVFPCIMHCSCFQHCGRILALQCARLCYCDTQKPANYTAVGCRHCGHYMLRRTVACPPAERLEAAEALLVAGTSGDDAQHIEAHSLAQRPEDSSKDRAAAHRRLELTNAARGGIRGSTWSLRGAQKAAATGSTQKQRGKTSQAASELYTREQRGTRTGTGR